MTSWTRCVRVYLKSRARNLGLKSPENNNNNPSDYNRAFAEFSARALIKAASGDDRALAPTRPLGHDATAEYCFRQVLLLRHVGAPKCCWCHMSQPLHVAATGCM